MQSDPADIVGLVGAGLAFVFGQTIANLVGPYIAIIILAFGGACISISEVDWGWVRQVRYVVVRPIVAVALTVYCAEMINHIAPWASPRITLIPIAFCMGWIRDWEHLKQICGRLIQAKNWLLEFVGRLK